MKSNRTEMSTGLMLILLLLATFAALFAGLLAVIGNTLIFVLLVVALLGIGLIVKPRLAVWVVIIGGTVVSGLTELYLPSFQQIRWAIALLSMALIISSAVTWAFYNREASKNLLNENAKIIVIIVLAFIASVFFTLIANPSSIANGAVGLKNYFQMFGLLAALTAFQYTPKEASKFMKFIPILGLIQLPFALHQFIHFVPLRSSGELAQLGVVAVDVVAGTFGGAAMGGGRSSTLAILASIAMVMVIAQWLAKTRTYLSAFLYSLIFVIPMLLNEAKLFIVLLPIGIFMLLKGYISKNPFKTLLASLVVVGLLATIVVGYSMLPGAKSQKMVSLDKYLDSNISYNFGNRGYGNFVLNRSTVYSFWWRENIGRDNYLNIMFGHGPGVTNASSVVAKKTLANTRYQGYGIGLTGVSALLWEVGLMGVFAVFALLLMTYKLGSNLEKKWKGTDHWPLIKSAQIAMVFFGISLLHNSYFVTDISYQALLVLFIGYLLAMSRHDRTKC